jgi:hypothetical protein
VSAKAVKRTQFDETRARYELFVSRAQWWTTEFSDALFVDRPDLSHKAVAAQVQFWAKHGSAKRLGPGRYMATQTLEQFDAVWRERLCRRTLMAVAAGKPYRDRVAAQAAARRATKGEAIAADAPKKPARSELIPPPKPRIDLTYPAWLRGLV